MGFSTLIDILGSTVIGGLLLLILLRLNDASIDNNFIYGGELNVQENLVEVVSLIEYDFRRIGYCADYTNITPNAPFITYADSNAISFLSDIAISKDIKTGDGVLDTIKYFLGPTTELLNSPNPKDRILYRVINNGPRIGANLGVTQFYIKYFDVLGDSLSIPIANYGRISTMQINVTVENTAGITPKYEENAYTVEKSAFWRQIRLAARNLKNR